MKSSRWLCFIAILLFTLVSVEAQKRRAVSKPKTTTNDAMVIDETLSVLRIKPSLFADSIQRMRRGRRVKILETKQADGVTFYRVSAPPSKIGWLQADSIYGDFRRGDDERLAKLIQASNNFEKIELAANFLELFPSSNFRPAILLLLGDLAEETAAKLSLDAAKRLDKREMAASGAPMHSYYLNFASLDRYRKLGIVFLFETKTKNFHYDGANWQEIIKEFPNSSEAIEARKRIETLKTIFAESN